MQMPPKATISSILICAWLAIMSILWVFPSPLANTGAEPYGLGAPVKAINVRCIWFIDALRLDDVQIWIKWNAFATTVGISIAVTIAMFLNYRPLVRRWDASIAARRLARSECPKCGYALREKFEQGCAECGW